MNAGGHVILRLTRAVTVCGWLGDGAGQRATPRLRGEFVEFLLLLHKLDLLREKKRRQEIHIMIIISIYGLMLLLCLEVDFKCFLGWKTKTKMCLMKTVQPFFLSCTLKTQDCLLNLICNSTLHIPLNTTRQQRTMWSGFLGIKVRKTVHSFCPDGTGRVHYSVPQSDCCYLTLTEVGILVLPDFRGFLMTTRGDQD